MYLCLNLAAMASPAVFTLSRWVHRDIIEVRHDLSALTHEINISSVDQDVVPDGPGLFREETGVELDSWVSAGEDKA